MWDPTAQHNDTEESKIQDSKRKKEEKKEKWK